MKKYKNIFWFSALIIVIMFFSLNVTFASERSLRTTWTWPAYIDPAIGYDTTSSVALVNLYDALVFSNVKGEAQPHVAESWKVSDDGLTWTFYIRKGIKFHDGSELTASDVKFSFDRLVAIGRGFSYSFLGQEIRTEVVDPYTINFYLKEPNGTFLKNLAYCFILNEDLIRANIKETGEYGELGDYGKEYLITNDAGSGPYMVKDVEIGSSITMVVNENYWIPIDPNAPDEFVMMGKTEAVT